MPADTTRHYRLRGTNLGIDVPGETENGEPLVDPREPTPPASQMPGETSTIRSRQANWTRLNRMNATAYSDMWFYSNPIYVEIEDNVAAKMVLKSLIVEAETFTESTNTAEWYAFAEVLKQAKLIYTDKNVTVEQLMKRFVNCNFSLLTLVVKKGAKCAL